MLKQKVIDKMIKPTIVDNTKLKVPWTNLSKPLEQCRVALVTTAGVHMKDQKPFDTGAKKGDASYREIPSNASKDDYQISHTHYDHSEADKDINCVFPIDRLRELVSEGFIGSVANISYGFMGFILKPLHDQLKVNAKKVAQELLAEKVDVVLLTPG